LIGPPGALRALCASALLLSACSAPARPADLAAAEKYEHEGKDAEAAEAYARAVVTCEQTRERYVRDRWCAAALSGHAETLERLGRVDEAAAAWERVPARIREGDVPAHALVEAARLHLLRGRDVRAYELYWEVIVDFPDAPGAEDALRHVVRDGRKRDPRKLVEVLTKLREGLAGTQVDDNVLFASALLARDDLGDGAAALALFDAYTTEFPEGPLFDDAAWEAARLARAAGDAQGALDRYAKLLATRERAYVIGSYHSVWLDDAQLETGRLLRDELHDPRRAAAAFETLLDHYPTSILRDDAVWELTVTRDRLGDATAACKTLSRLAKDFPDSRYLLDDAPRLKDRLGCDFR
jgi:tetratricopeptide (TPR) repeat protein